MKAARVLVPVVCAFVGFGVGAFVYPGPYVYGNSNGASTRINRITGVEQYASSKGWVTREEATADAIKGFFGGAGNGVRSVGEAFSSPSGFPPGRPSSTPE